MEFPSRDCYCWPIGHSLLPNPFSIQELKDKATSDTPFSDLLPRIPRLIADLMTSKASVSLL